MRTSPAFPAPVAHAAYEGDLMRDPDFGFEPPERCGLVRCLTHGIPSPLGWTFHLLTYIAFAWALAMVALQFRRGERVPALLLGLCLAVQFAALLWGDLVIDLMGMPYPYVDAFSFLPFVLLMGLSMASQLHQRTMQLEQTTRRLRAEAETRQQAELSLRNLGVEQIGLFQLHRIDPEVPLEDQVGELKRLQDEGKIRHIGLSEVSVEQVEAASEVATIATVQNLYNLANRSAEKLLTWSEEHGVGFIPWFPLATGELAKPGSPLTAIAESKQLSDDTKDALGKAFDDFASGFTTADGHSIVGKEKPADPMAAEDVDREKVQVRKPPPPRKN